MLDWLDSFLVTGLFGVTMITGLALLLHLQLGLTRIANFGVVGFWGLGYYVFGVLYIQIDWPFGDPWQFLVCAAGATAVAGLAGLVVGWIISDLDTDGVLVVTLGFATAVPSPGHHEGRCARWVTRARRAPHTLRRGHGEGGRVRLADRPGRGRRSHLPLRPPGSPLAVRAPAHRHGWQ